MRCSSRHTLVPIDSISGGHPPQILPPRVRLVEAHSLQSQRRPTPSSLLKNVYCGPEWRPTPFSPSTVYISLGCRFCFLDTPGVHEAKILTEHSCHPLPHFQPHKVVVVLILREARGGWLIPCWIPRPRITHAAGVNWNSRYLLKENLFEKITF